MSIQTRAIASCILPSGPAPLRSPFQPFASVARVAGLTIFAVAGAFLREAVSFSFAQTRCLP